ncbi:MAG: AAA family ATPase [Candidatus Woesearchaeota archaeon]
MQNLETRIDTHNGKIDTTIRKFSRREILAHFMNDLKVREVYEQPEYIPKVVQWCFPEFSGESRVSYKQVSSLYHHAIRLMPDLRYENMYATITKGFKGKIDTLSGTPDDDPQKKKEPKDEPQENTTGDQEKEDRPLTDIIAEHDFADMKDKLNERVIGQEKAIDDIMDWMLLLKYDASLDPESVTNLYLMGPSGVGKTTFVKSLSEILDVPSLIIPGSEYKHEHTVSNLFGAPSGYIGYNENGGTLTRFVRESPSSIVLIDEADKLHNEIYRNLTNLMDTGLLSAPNGEEYYFNGILFMTSNLGNNPESAAHGRSIGFNSEEYSTDYEREKHRMMELVKQSFPREIRSRMDDFVMFDSLGREEAAKILDTYVEQTKERFPYAKLPLMKAAYEEILDRGLDQETGVRELQKVYERNVFMPVLRRMESDPEFRDADKIKIGYDGNEFTYTPVKKPQKQG